MAKKYIDYPAVIIRLEYQFGSQKALAESLGRSPRQLQRYKSGDTKPTGDIRKKIYRRARYYGVRTYVHELWIHDFNYFLDDTTGEGYELELSVGWKMDPSIDLLELVESMDPETPSLSRMFSYLLETYRDTHKHYMNRPQSFIYWTIDYTVIPKDGEAFNHTRRTEWIEAYEEVFIWEDMMKDAFSDIRDFFGTYKNVIINHITVSYKYRDYDLREI